MPGGNGLKGGERLIMSIKIQYNGEYPNLCSGKLVVTVDGKRWNFSNCLSSGGSVSFDEDWSEVVEQGEWSVEWPEAFPDELKTEVLSAINDEIPHGCCGGCV